MWTGLRGRLLRFRRRPNEVWPDEKKGYIRLGKWIMTPLRVVMATRFPYAESDGFSGLLQVSANLCNALAKRSDIELHVVSGTSRIQKVEHRRLDNYNVTFYPFPPTWTNYGSFFLQSALRMKRQLLRIQPDIVHCQATAETVLAGHMSALPMVTTIHGIYSSESTTAHTVKAKIVSRIQGIVESWYVRRLRHVISCSEYISQFVRKHNLHARLYDVSNPIDPLFFDVDIQRTRPVPQSILIVGIISYRKGHDLLIESMAELVRKFGDARLTIIGNETEQEFVKTMHEKIQSLGLTTYIHWIGPVSQDQLIDQMKSHHVVCLPSREETLPMSISQAMAVGNIVVASDAGGLRYMVKHGDNGFQFCSGDSVGLSRALEEALSLSPQQTEAMRVQNRQYAETTFHPDCVASKTVEVYREILARR